MRRKLVWDTHKQAHAGAQRVLSNIQLRWYWPWMESEIRCRVRQCETCRASQHGRPPDQTRRWKRPVEGPRQVEAVNLAGNRRGTPRRDVVRRGGPLPAREVRRPAPKHRADTATSRRAYKLVTFHTHSKCLIFLDRGITLERPSPGHRNNHPSPWTTSRK